MNRMQQLREAKGLSRRRTAQLADLDAPSYGKAESGRVLTAAQLARVARALGHEGPPAALLEEVPPLEAGARAMLEAEADDA